MRSPAPAYTLVELLVALALSLLLLLAVTELFSRVGGTMNNARTAMSASANLNEAAIMLRQDLAKIPDTLASKPERIANPNVEAVDDRDGYLEIIEGPDTIESHPYVDEKRERDATVGDVDDIIAFTATVKVADGEPKFRGLFDGKIIETESAEIIWFVRGNTLYRRVVLVDETKSVSEQAQRDKRLLHRVHDSSAASPTNRFPFPLYDPDPAYSGWRYLRVPTLEETIHDDWKTEGIQWKTVSGVPPQPTEPLPDLWEQPYFFPDLQDRKSGSLKQYVESPRNVRAGEDIILTNVLSFDVKVWCPLTEDFVDLGMKGTTWEWDEENNPQPGLWHTWDSWTQAYKKPPDETTIEPPPFAARLEAIRITIRCFDPPSRTIKQVTVVHRFEN